MVISVDEYVKGLHWNLMKLRKKIVDFYKLLRPLHGPVLNADDLLHVSFATLARSTLSAWEYLLFVYVYVCISLRRDIKEIIIRGPLMLIFDYFCSYCCLWWYYCYYCCYCCYCYGKLLSISWISKICTLKTLYMS